MALVDRDGAGPEARGRGNPREVPSVTSCPWRADLSDEASGETGRDAPAAHFGGLDILVNRRRHPRLYGALAR